MCAMYPLRGQSLTNVPIDLFLHEANRHERLEVLRQEALSRGVSILVQEVGYL